MLRGSSVQFCPFLLEAINCNSNSLILDPTRINNSKRYKVFCLHIPVIFLRLNDYKIGVRLAPLNNDIGYKGFDLCIVGVCMLISNIFQTLQFVNLVTLKFHRLPRRPPINLVYLLVTLAFGFVFVRCTWFISGMIKWINSLSLSVMVTSKKNRCLGKFSTKLYLSV